MKRPKYQYIIIILIGIITIVLLAYLAIFGRALGQSENHLGIALALPKVLFSSAVVRIDDKTYLAKNTTDFNAYMKQQGYINTEQLGSGHFFEKNGLNYIATSRMYSSLLMIFTFNESEGQIKKLPLGGDRDEHGCIPSAGYSWCASANKCIRPWEELCESDINFSKTGVAIKESSKVNGENLYILYEEPGKPALRAKLLFNEKSLCGDETHKIICMALSVSDYGLTNGRKIEIKGIKTDEQVEVRQLMMTK
jgi:hypothetical protein